MNVTRRRFLKATAALYLLPTIAKANIPSAILEAKAASMQLIGAEFGDYPKTEIWGFQGTVPGPLLRFKQGDTLQQTLHNNLPQPTSIHWHGLRLPNAMDGVPGFTQDAVPTGETFDYAFPLKDAGTFWYHSHNRSTEQVARGLYGVIVVKEHTPPDVDHDIVVVLDDWRLDETAQITDDFGAMHDWTHAGRMGNYVHAHLTPSPDTLQKNARVRLRFVNVASDRIMTIAIQGGSGKVVARDGMPLQAPEDLGALVFGPAERADVILDVDPSEAQALQIVFLERDTGYLLHEIPLAGDAEATRGPIQALPANPVSYLSSLEGAREIPLVMEGGAMGRMESATFDGEDLSTRELVQKGKVWAFNGIVGMPDAPLATLRQGELVRMPIANDTAFAHAMHLHGTHFQEVLPDGGFGPMKDTILVQPRETREIAFVAPPPGKWLFHCHMLSHQSAGMKTWFEVV
ncbi:multicopper oxidase family protein [Shimia sp. R10_1]|uniref:multicopper oxidase family protein n=1 Tax=Shimia sp. R10_1 TaxID=2821095 RepID=UPI001AD9743D|nr:multicopper oxidase family protein [Shimia sp. R10_1]MBO9474689.1 multicopper oxidase family protein [Shimia sp. R10_1]